MEIKTLETQSLLDIAIQEGGGIESLFDLALKNDLSITEKLTPGQNLITPVITNVDTQNYYRIAGLKPATDVGEIEQGIEFWYIEYDFIVS